MRNVPRVAATTSGERHHTTAEYEERKWLLARDQDSHLGGTQIAHGKQLSSTCQMMRLEQRSSCSFVRSKVCFRLEKEVLKIWYLAGVHGCWSRPYSPRIALWGLADAHIATQSCATTQAARFGEVDDS